MNNFCQSCCSTKCLSFEYQFYNLTPHYMLIILSTIFLAFKNSRFSEDFAAQIEHFAPLIILQLSLSSYIHFCPQKVFIVKLFIILIRFIVDIYWNTACFWSCKANVYTFCNYFCPRDECVECMQLVILILYFMTRHYQAREQTKEGNAHSKLRRYLFYVSISTTYITLYCGSTIYEGT